MNIDPHRCPTVLCDGKCDRRTCRCRPCGCPRCQARAAAACSHDPTVPALPTRARARGERAYSVGNRGIVGSHLTVDQIAELFG